MVDDTPRMPPSRPVTPEEKTAQDRRNRAIAFGVVAFIAIVFLTTVLRLVQNTGSSGGGIS